MYVEEVNESKFKKVIEKLGFKYVPEKAGQIGKNVYTNSSFTPPLRLEYGTVEQGIRFYEKLYGKVDPTKIKILLPDTPLGRLDGQQVFTPTLEGLKTLTEINYELAKKNGSEEYLHKVWMEKMIKILELRSP